MNVKTADRIIEIVETFADQKRPLTLSDLARALSIPVSSCLGLVRTLSARGYLYEVQRRGGFYPTARLHQKTTIIAAHDPILERVGPSLAALRDGTGETVVLGRLRDTEVIYLLVLESSRPVRYSAEVGSFRPAHANSIGKALLGSLEEAERQAFVARLDMKGLTARTCTDPACLEADLEEARVRGWYANLGESDPDLGAVACPLRLGSDWYAVSIAGPLSRISGEIKGHTKALTDSCKSIERVFREG